MIKILITNIGRRTYFARYLEELIKLKYPIKVYLSDASKNTAGFYVNKKFKKVIFPRVNKSEKKYIMHLKTFCKKEKINLVIPLIDTDLNILAKNKDEFKKINTTILVSDIKILNQLKNKINAYKFCKKNNLNYPKIYTSEMFIKTPFIYKDISGSASKGLKILKNKKQIPIKPKKNFFLQEYIKGKEYNLDILNDLKGNYIHSTSKLKIEMRSGETDKAKIVKFKSHEKLAKKISKLLSHIGPIDVDFIMNEKNKIYLIDFNFRFGGGYPFTHRSGSNYLKAIIDNYLGKKIEIKKNRQSVLFKGIEILNEE